MTESRQARFQFNRARPDPRDITKNRHRGADTSNVAFASTPAKARAKHRRIILDLVWAAGAYGKTCYEIEVALRLRHQTASARVSELLKDGWIEDSGQRRPTDTGRPARVLIVTKDR